MRKIFTMLMAAVVCLGLAGCSSSNWKQEDGVIYFRDSVWGMSMDDITEVEGSEAVSSGEGFIQFSDTFEGYTAEVTYSFNNNGELCKGSYNIEDVSENDYEELKEILNHYGDSVYEYTVSDDTGAASEVKWELDGIDLHLVYFDSGTITILYENRTFLLTAWLLKQTLRRNSKY